MVSRGDVPPEAAETCSRYGAAMIVRLVVLGGDYPSVLCRGDSRAMIEDGPAAKTSRVLVLVRAPSKLYLAKSCSCMLVVMWR